MKIITNVNKLMKGFLSGFSFSAMLFISGGVSAQTGAALNFDGTDDNVNCGTALTTSLINATGLTVEAWIRPTSITGVRPIISNHDGGGGTQFSLRTDGSTYNFFLGFGAFGVTTAANTVTLNTLQHVAAVYNYNNSVSIYINGVFSASVSMGTYSLVNSGQTVLIGRDGFSSFFNGDIDEVRVWKRALCASEILANKNYELVGPQLNLLANYRFNHGTAGANNAGITTLQNVVNNTANGTLQNFALNNATSNWIAPGGVTTGSLSNGSGTITVNSGTINPGQTFTMNPTGGVNYTFSSGSATVAPQYITNYGVYSIVGGCVHTNISTVTVNAGALNFDRVNDHVNLGTALTNSLANQNKFSVEAWVKPSVSFTSGAYGCVVGNYSTLNNTPPMQFLLRGNAGFWTFFVQASGTFTGVNTTTINVNQWQHLAATWDGTVGSIYLNGVLSNTASMAGAGFTTATNPVWIGGNTINNEYFSGDIDEVRIWNRVLCQSEIQNNMNGELSLPQNSLMSYYKLNQGVSGGTNTLITTASDLGSANVTGTLTNMALTGTTSNWVASGGFTYGTVAPTYTISGFSVTGPSTLCTGSSVTFTAAGVNSYTWSTGANTTTIAVSPTVNSTYNVIGTASNNCQATIVKSVTVNPLPTVGASSSTICVGETTTLTANGASTYSWNNGANTISVSVNPTTTTVYTVTGTSSVGCVNTGTSSVTVNLCTSLNQIGNTINETKLYPNPNNGVFNMELSSAAKVKILDILGRSVYSENLAQGNYKMDLTTFENGIYFVQINQNNSINTIKIIKE